MPTYSEIGADLGNVQPDDSLNWLAANIRKMLAEMERHTGRPVVLYEANHRTVSASHGVQMREKDLEYFMDVLRGLKSDSLDLIVNSWGGSPDAADMIGSYLRQKFKSIRSIVPVEAMSAATMLVCGSERIVMGKHSFLGPIDLQMTFVTPDGPRHCAAEDVLDQYGKVRSDFKEDMRAFWEGPGARYWPDALIRCENALSYGREVAQRGLQEAMFREESDAEARAKAIASDLADHQKHRAHARRLSRAYLRDLGMKVEDLEADDRLQDLVLTIHHLSSHWFEGLPFVAKLMQSSQGRVAFELDESVYAGDAKASGKLRRILHRLAVPAPDGEKHLGPPPSRRAKGKKVSTP